MRFISREQRGVELNDRVNPDFQQGGENLPENTVGIAGK